MYKKWFATDNSNAFDSAHGAPSANQSSARDGGSFRLRPNPPSSPTENPATPQPSPPPLAAAPACHDCHGRRRKIQADQSPSAHPPPPPPHTSSAPAPVHHPLVPAYKHPGSPTPARAPTHRLHPQKKKTTRYFTPRRTHPSSPISQSRKGKQERKNHITPLHPSISGFRANDQLRDQPARADHLLFLFFF